MNINKLLKMEMGEAIGWLISNQHDFTIVPREPTIAMRIAYHESMDDFNDGIEKLGQPDDSWSAMISEWEAGND